MGWPKGKPRKQRIEAPLHPEAQELVDKVVAEQVATKPQEPQKPLKMETEPPKRTFSQPNNKWDMKNADWGDPGAFNPAETEIDALHIPPEEIPDGMSFQWVPVGILGKDEPKFLANAERNNWRVVHNMDFGARWNGRYARRGSDEPITYENVVLVARPQEFTDRARREEARKAQEQATLKLGSLLSGQIPGVTGASHKTALAQNKISRSLERIAVPDDE